MSPTSCDADAPLEEREAVWCEWFTGVEVILTYLRLARVVRLCAGGALLAKSVVLSIPPSPIIARKLAKNGSPRLDGLLRAAPSARLAREN